MHILCNRLNESDVLAIARAMVATGLRDAGYTYVNLDCGYSAGAKNSGKPLAVDEDRFPHGTCTMRCAKAEEMLCYAFMKFTMLFGGIRNRKNARNDRVKTVFFPIYI